MKKSIKVKATVQFNDFLENETRYPGDEWVVTEERLEEIYTKGGPWVEVVERSVEEDLQEEIKEEEDKGKGGKKSSKKGSDKESGKGKA